MTIPLENPEALTGVIDVPARIDADLSAVIDRVEWIELSGRHTPTRPYWNCDRHPGEPAGPPAMISDPSAGPRPVRHRYLRVWAGDAFGIYGPIDSLALGPLQAGMAQAVLGLDPLNVERVWQSALVSQRHRGGTTQLALAAIDNACWDLRGRAAGAPVCQLLGGCRNDVVRLYATMLGSPPELDGQLAWCRAVRQQGFADQKWKSRVMPGDDVAARRRETDRLIALNAAVGEGWLGYDASRMWTPEFAIAMLDGLGEAGLDFLEEPIDDGDIPGWRRLREAAKGRVALAAGEHLLNAPSLRQYLDNDLLDIVQIDPEWCGGITGALRMIHLIAERGGRFMPHGHGLRAAWHLVAALPVELAPRCEWLVHKMESYWGWFERNWPHPTHGQLAPPTGAGFAIEFDADRIEHQAIQRLAEAD